MKKIWIVYREYTDWDEYSKENIKAFLDETSAVLFMELVNHLHNVWCGIDYNVRSKRSDIDSWETLLHDSRELEIINKLESLLPEYKEGIDSRYDYCIESVDFDESEIA